MSPSFRLIITTDIEYTWNYAITLCESLLQSINAEILLVSLGGKPSEIQSDRVKKSKLQVLYTEYPPSIDPSRVDQNKEAAYYLEDVIEEFNPTLVHINNEAFYDLHSSKPRVITIHDDYINRLKWTENRGCDFHLPSYLSNYKEFIVNGLHQADIIVTPSRFSAEQVFKSYNLKNKIKVINNGISIEPYSEFQKDPVIFTVSRYWDKSKNLGLFLKAVSRLPDNVKVYMAGECNYYKELPKKVHYLGSLSPDKLHQEYRNASIFLALSSYENFGTTLTEAAYANCAIVANDIPAFKELWDDCACFYETNNLNSLIRNLNNLIENDRLLEITAKNCQAKALSSYNSRRMGFEYINLYKYVLQKNPSKLKNINAVTD